MKKWFGLALVVIGVIALVAVWRGDNLLGGLKLGKSTAVDISKSQDASEADKLRIEVGSADVELISVDGSELRVHLQGRQRGLYINRGEPDVTLQQRGGAIEVNAKQQGGWGIGMSVSNLKLTVEVPQQLWRELAVSTGSGELTATDVAADLVRMSTGSGDMALEQIVAQSGDFRVGSGEVQGRDIRTDTLVVKSGSGDIELTSLFGSKATLSNGSGNISVVDYELSELSLDASSGDIELQDGTAQVKGRTGSGNIELQVDELRQDTDLDSGSGDIDVKLADAPQSLEVRYDGGSGRGRIGWDGFVQDGDDRQKIRGAFGNGDVLLEVRTGSGNFTLD